MEIAETKASGDQITLALAGRLDAQSAKDVEDKLDQIIEKGHVNVNLNFQEVSYISSSGLRVLLTTLKKVRQNSGSLKLFGMAENVKEVFAIAGLDDIFEILDQEP